MPSRWETGFGRWYSLLPIGSCLVGESNNYILLFRCHNVLSSFPNNLLSPNVTSNCKYLYRPLLDRYSIHLHHGPKAETSHQISEHNFLDLFLLLPTLFPAEDSAMLLYTPPEMTALRIRMSTYLALD